MNAAYVIQKNISVFTTKTRPSPVVEIENGRVQGKLSTSRQGRTYFQYLGIPYAQPPIGPLRFQAPLPWKERWEETRDATKDGAKAMQFDAMSKKPVGSEDCLFLNVHTPRIESNNNALLPVLVWFHGGSFIIGSGNDYKPDYFLDHDVVVVTVNYRLGPFGFLNTGDGVVRGNMGLKDQNMALRWVQANISFFGGNPNDVTIAGESAGGASVHFQVLSPMSKGLFHKAVSQSGMATLPFSIHPNPGKLARRFGKLLQINMDTTQEMVRNLMGLKAETLASVQLGMFDNFRPTIEQDFGDGTSIITQSPLEIIKSGNYSKVPYVLGVNSGEGILLATPVLTNKEVLPNLNKAWGKTLAPFLFLPDTFDGTKLDATKSLYLDGKFDENNPMESMAGMSSLFSDAIWNYGFHEAAIEHSANATKEAPLFLYFYDYTGLYSLSDLVMAIGGNFHPIFELIKIKGKKWFKENIKKEEIPNYGPCHGDGLSMQWYMPSMAHVPQKSPDYKVSREVVDSLVQFLKWNPRNRILNYHGQKWEEQKKGKGLRYMHICEKATMIQEPFTKRLEFWVNLTHE